MPYYDIKPKTKIGEQLQELAGKLPTPLNWLVPNPYDPSSYIVPIGGMTKQQILKSLEKLGVQRQAYMPSYVSRIPRGLRQQIDNIINVLDVYKSEPPAGFHIRQGNVPKSLIGLEKGVSQETPFHEVGHIIYHNLTDKERNLLSNVQQRTGLDAREMIADAYQDLITGISSGEVTDPFVKHLVKKYHKLMR